MTAALSGELRSALESVVQDARACIEDDLAASLGGRCGINADGTIEPEAALSLSNAELAVRRDLVEIVEFLRAEGESDAASVARLVREAAFTQTNRLVAVRVAEAVGVLPETMSKALESSGFRDFSELAPTVAVTEWGRFAVLVGLCADELAADIPALFDPRNPLLELPVSEPVFADVVESIAGLGEEVWAAPDALGWAYQFFNTGAERREMRESSAPRNSRELAVRNQFFTPSYVVEFLVQNGLGAHLAAGFPELADELELLVEVPAERREVDLAAVSVLDPACGSGHFLLGAYDVLEAAWGHAGVEPGEAAPAIVSSLWGIDIDPRAAQIAQAAVMFRARRHCISGELPVANVICARALPAGPEVDAFVGSLPGHTARVVRAVSEELVSAPVLGPLLKIEERLDREARDVFGTGVIEGTLSEVAANQDEADVLDALATIADTTTSSPAQRLFAAEAHDAVRFVEAMNRRYTAVLMNPPFGEPVPETKDYLKAAYPWIPPTGDLLAAFVGRGLELAATEVGTCSAITGRAGLFLKTFEKWRKEVLLGNKIDAVLDLGFGVMEQALVEAAAYVLRNQAPIGEATFIRMLKEVDRPDASANAISQFRNAGSDPRVFNVSVADFEAIPGSPLSYWMSDSIRGLFARLEPLEGSAGEAGKGHDTGEDFRFIRAFWEVEGSLADTQRWVPCAKGGAYSPYWSDLSLVVDWQANGSNIKSHPKGYVRNEHLNYRGGVTWPRRTNSGFGVRLKPAGSILVDKGAGVIGEEPFVALGWMRSRLVQAMLDAMVAAGEEVSSGGASRSYEVGLVQKLAWMDVPEVGPVAERLARRRAQDDEVDEVTRRFVGPPTVAGPIGRVLDQLEDGAELDRLVNAGAGLDAEGLAYLEDEIGRYPTAYPESAALDDRVADLWERPIGDVIDELIEERGGSRSIANLTFVADRRVEVIAHGLELHPCSILRVVSERGLVAPGEQEDSAFRLVSYLVGVAFGRWDVRIGRSPETASVPDDLLAPPAPLSPGMLLGPGGGAAVSAPDDYPTVFPADGVLVDEPGSDRDLSDAVRAAAAELSGSEAALEAAVGVLMKRPNVEGFLRSQFYKGHLSMYSMSRRRAPIYWQLQVPSKNWGVWLYAPKLSREMLFGVAREAERRLRLAEQQIGHLEREGRDGGSGRRAADVAKELEAEQKLAVELETFRAEAERIAGLGWEPDLDDGMVLNAAPLASLFPAWKDAGKYRKELKAGKNEWATVARYANQL